MSKGPEVETAWNAREVGAEGRVWWPLSKVGARLSFWAADGGDLAWPPCWVQTSG